MTARLFLVFISLLINCTYGIRCQTVFDIYVDEIYLDDDGDVYFFNRGEKTNYECEVIGLNQGEYLNALALECDEAYLDPEERIFFNQDSVLKFSTHLEFNAWLKDQSFESIRKNRYRTEKNVIQFLNQHLIVSASFNKASGGADWRFNSKDYWDYVYFRINDSFLIIGLVYENDAQIGGWLIPTLDGGYLKTNFGHYTSTQKRIRLDSLESHRYQLQSFIRSEKINGKYLVKDKLFDEVIRPDTFDNLKIGQRYCIEKIENQYQIYDLLQDSVILNGLMLAHDSLGYLLFIRDNRLQWMDYQGHVQDTNPRTCGSSVERSAQRKEK